MKIITASTLTDAMLFNNDLIKRYIASTAFFSKTFKIWNKKKVADFSLLHI